jgi:hypothetical protein
LDEATVLDFLVLGPERLLIFREKRYKICLEEWNENELIREWYSLPNDKVPLKAFGGSIQQDRQGIRLYMYGAEGLEYVLFNKKGGRSRRTIGLKGISAVLQVGGTSYFLQPGHVTSSIYKENWELTLDKKMDGYVDAMTHKGRDLYVLKQDFNGTSSLYALHSGDTLKSWNEPVKQVILRDSLLYYLSAANGVFNAKRYAFNTQEDVFLTDYRSDIIYHAFSGEYMIEYISKLQASALYMSEVGDELDMHYMDTVLPTYFRQLADTLRKETFVVSDEMDLDSLPDYKLQTPFPADKDFTSSNYDSLKAEADQRSNYIATQSDALNRFKRNTIFVQLYNELNMHDNLPFEESLSSYTPNRVQLRIGGTVLNQFGNQSIYATYNLFPRFRHEFDAAVRYDNWQGKRPFHVEVMQRHRIHIGSEDRVTRDQSSILRVGVQLKQDPEWNVQQQLTLRYDEKLFLGSTQELLNAASKEKAELSLPVTIRYQTSSSSFRQWGLRGMTQINPSLLMPQESLNLSLRFNLNTHFQMNSWFDIENSTQLGASWGQNPNFFVIGGTSTDVLSSMEERYFSSAFDAAYHTMVYGIRGFNVNYRNGTSFAVNSLQFGISPINLLVKRPIYSALLNQLKLVGFVDAAYSMYGKSYYDRSNALNVETFTTPGSSFTVEVRNVKNPLIGSMGFGLHSELYSYAVGVDWAYGIESSKVRDPMLHVSLSKYLW